MMCYKRILTDIYFQLSKFKMFTEVKMCVKPSKQPTKCYIDKTVNKNATRRLTTECGVNILQCLFLIL